MNSASKSLIAFDIGIDNDGNQMITHHALAKFISEMLCRKPAVILCLGDYGFYHIVHMLRSDDRHQWVLCPVRIPAGERRIEISLCQLCGYASMPKYLPSTSWEVC
jgi:hypothetical protein